MGCSCTVGGPSTPWPSLWAMARKGAFMKGISEVTERPAHGDCQRRCGGHMAVRPIQREVFLEGKSGKRSANVDMETSNEEMSSENEDESKGKGPAPKPS